MKVVSGLQERFPLYADNFPYGPFSQTGWWSLRFGPRWRLKV
jgi:predicted oxidoreductase (fatty acid repression mutant protein)